MIVCDTGPLVAAALRQDKDHYECVELLTGLHLAGREIVVPGPVIAEVGYLLAREGGAKVESFLQSIAEGVSLLLSSCHRTTVAWRNWCCGTQTCRLARPMRP